MTNNSSDIFAQIISDAGAWVLHRLMALSLAILVLSVSPPVAEAQDAGLSQRLERLERDIQTLSKMVVRGPSSVPATSVPGNAGGAADLPQNAVARIGVRLDAMESELRDVTGRLEELTFNLGQLTQRVDRLVADVDFRLTGLEQQGRPDQAVGKPATATSPGTPTAQLNADGSAKSAGAPLPEPVQIVGQGPRTLGQIEAERVPATGVPQGGATSGSIPTAGKGTAQRAVSTGNGVVAAPTTVSPPQNVTPKQLAPARGTPTTVSQSASQEAALPTGTPEEQYKFAFGLLRKHQFDQAEGAFKEFLQANPSSPLAGNARYWLAETHYARAEYVKAAEVFLQGYETNPKGAKAPDSLLKLAMSLGQLGQSKEACGAIAKLFADYPDANSSLKRTATRQQRQLNCK